MTRAAKPDGEKEPWELLSRAELGEFAASLTASPAYRAAMAALREESIAAWLATPATARDEREVAWLQVKLLDALDAKLNSIRVTGRRSS